MADRSLIEHLVAGGLPHEEAVRSADLVLGAIRPLLLAGKTVGIPGVGRLAAPLKPAWVLGPGPKRAAMQRRVKLRNPETIEKGEPYAVETGEPYAV